MKFIQPIAGGLALLGGVCLIGPPAAAQITIGTTVNGAQANSSVGSGGDYLGQVFTVPTDNVPGNNVLETFSVQLADAEPLTNFSIYAFDVNSQHIVGDALFFSGPVTGTEVPTGSLPYTALEDTYQTGGLTLTAGDTYLALIENVTYHHLESYAPLFVDTTTRYQHYPGYDYYSGGYFTAEYSSSGPFSPIFAGSDLAFQATFGPAAVPEASTTVSFGLLLTLGLGGVIAAKKKKATAMA